jgi:predicted enzyme related to lactoylglutathione lyase
MPDTPIRVTYMVMVEDAERARAFYRNALGAEIRGVVPDGSWTEMLVGGREVCLHGSRSPEAGTIDTGLAIEVEDLEQTCQAIVNAGGNVLRPDYDWIAIATDTEGNRFCVVRPKGCFLHPSLFPEHAAETTAAH